jgi:hypothetical protein
MRRSTLLGIQRTVFRTALFCAFALAGNVHAQVNEHAVTPSWQDPYTHGAYGAVAGTKQSTRGIFAATVVALVAQGVGSGIGTALSDGLGGSITRWFSRAPGAGGTGEAKHAIDEMGGQVEIARPHAGLAFEVHLIGADGATRAVDPSRHAFRTGDRFQVYYRPTLPGRISVFNVNPQGRESQIDVLEVAAGQLAALGPYQFVGEKGNEILRMVVAPCSSPQMTAATHGIIKVGSPSAGTEPDIRLGECSDSKMRGLSTKTRSIRKVTMDGLTAFALDPLTVDETGSGAIGPREVRIALRHR